MEAVPDKLARRGGASTREALLAAAAAEFNSHGFSGTDTNRIARAAGFAPQTFYRHFADKTEVFIRVYEGWQAEERRKVAAAMHGARGRDAQLTAVAVSLIEAHRAWARFRRSLRFLALEDDRIRAARAASRQTQLDALASILRPVSREQQVAALLTIERLCDAAADREIEDLGLDADAWVATVAEAVAALRQP